MGNGLTSAEGEKGNRNTSSKFQTEPISGQKFVYQTPFLGYVKSRGRSVKNWRWETWRGISDMFEL